MSTMASGLAQAQPARARAGSQPFAASASRRRAGARIGERFSTSGQTRIRHEILMGVERLFVRRRDNASRAAIGQDRPALFVVEEIRQHDLFEQLLVHRRVQDRRQRLDATIEIARHQIGRGNIELGLGRGQAVAGAEGIDAGVLEEAPDDRLDADVLRQARNARPQAADAAHDEIDLDAGLARVIERIDDLGIDQRVALAPDRALAAGLHMRDLLGDVGRAGAASGRPARPTSSRARPARHSR